MVSRLVIAVVVGVLVTLGCILLGLILAALNVEIAVTVGHFLTTWAPVFGVLAGLVQFFTGRFHL